MYIKVQYYVGKIGETGKIKFPIIEILANYYNVNPVWLMGYDVPMEREHTLNINNVQYDENTLRHIENYNKLNDLGKQTADIYVEDLTTIPKYTEKKEDFQANG